MANTFPPPHIHFLFSLRYFSFCFQTGHHFPILKKLSWPQFVFCPLPQTPSVCYFLLLFWLSPPPRLQCHIQMSLSTFCTISPPPLINCFYLMPSKVSVPNWVTSSLSNQSFNITIRGNSSWALLSLSAGSLKDLFMEHNLLFQILGEVFTLLWILLPPSNPISLTGCATFLFGWPIVNWNTTCPRPNTWSFYPSFSLCTCPVSVNINTTPPCSIDLQRWFYFSFIPTLNSPPSPPKITSFPSTAFSSDKF